MAWIALKVDVDTLRGTQEGLPALLRLLDRHRAQATVLFSLGPDHTGWAIRRLLRPGFLGKVTRTSVVAHYGLRTLLHGLLLPAPDIGRLARPAMRSALASGHEGGIHAWDHVVWQDHVRRKDVSWTRDQMARAFARYVDVLGQRPTTHGAAGWQMNAAAFHQIDNWGLAYASDGRGVGPYVPVVGGITCRHVQIPTTLPTLDELIGRDGCVEGNVARRLMALTESDRDQVYTLHAELEGGRFSPAFDALLGGWRAQGHSLVSLARIHARLVAGTLPTGELRWGRVAGRSGELIVG